MTERKARFADHFTLEQASELLALEARDGQASHGEALAIVAVAMRGFAEALRAEGALPEIAGTAGHHLRFAECWNRIARGEATDRDWPDFARHVGYRIALEGTYVPQGKKALSAEAAHAKICAYADKGTFFGVEAGQSRKNGSTVYLAIKDWTATGTAYEDGERVPLADAPEPQPQVGEVTFPTGRLLASDWFHVKGFTKAMKGCESDVGCDDGRAETTRRHLAKGVAHVVLSNNSPDVYVRDGAVIIGQDRAYEEFDRRSGEDWPEPRDLPGKVGSICTDLWAATVVDRQTLTEIIAGELGSTEAAEEAIEAFRKQYGHVLCEFEVPAGTYELHFGGDFRKFAKSFRHEAVPALAEISAYGALIPKAA